MTEEGLWIKDCGLFLNTLTTFFRRGWENHNKTWD